MGAADGMREVTAAPRDPRRGGAAGTLVLAAVAVLGCAFVVAGLLRLGPRVVEPFAPSAIQAVGAAAYRVGLPEPRLSFWRPHADRLADRAFKPRRSTARLLEDGRELGPAHASEQDIATLGQGRFRLWRSHAEGRSLLFSTSDNTDPRSNGRRYALSYRAMPPPWLLLAVALGSCVATWRCYRGSRRLQDTALRCLRLISGRACWRVLVYGAAVYVLGTVLLRLPPIPVLSPDSGTYVSFHPIRSFGYPSFLWLVRHAAGSLEALPAVQSVLFVAAVLYAFESLLMLCRHPFVAGLTALAILACGWLLATMFWVLSEPLYITALVVCAASGCHALARPGARVPLLVLALGAAAVVFIRPAGYFVPAAVVFLALVWRAGRLQVVRYTLVPMVLVIACSMAVSHALRGTGTQSIGGMSLFPYVSHLFDPGLADARDRAVAEQLATISRPYADELARQPGWRAQYLFSMNNFNRILGAMTAKVGGQLPDEGGDLNEHMKRLATQTILAHPRGYLTQVAHNAAGAWVLCIFAPYGSLPREALASQQASAATPPADIRSTVFGLPAVDVETLRARYPALDAQRFAFIDNGLARLLRWQPLRFLLAAATLLALPLALARPHDRPAWLAFAFVGALIHGGVLLTAAATVFIPRYGLPVEPLLLIALGLGLDRVLSRLRGDPPPSRPVRRVA